MGIFRKKQAQQIPEECRGMQVRTQSSTCTGETLIGFYDRRSGELMYPELVRSQEDIDAFCQRYGIQLKIDN